MILLGIDPGTAKTGYGVIEIKDNTIVSLGYGQIKTSKDYLMQERLFKIYNSMKHLIENYTPDSVVIEKIFFNTNVKTAMTVGQSRGVCMMTAGKFQLPVYEYTALQAKMALTGYGRSDKSEVRAKVKELLNIKIDIKPIDASDALAIALCHKIKLDQC